MTPGFTCSVCGEYHDELMLDVRMDLPEPIFELPEAERAARAEVADDAAILGNGATRYFVRGLLEIPIVDHDRYFGYGTWLEVDADSYERLGELWFEPDGGQEEGPFDVAIANALEPYAGTVGLRAQIRLRDENLLPTVHLLEGDHPLVRDQRQGITLDRAQELAAVVMH